MKQKKWHKDRTKARFTRSWFQRKLKTSPFIGKNPSLISAKETKWTNGHDGKERFNGLDPCIGVGHTHKKRQQRRRRTKSFPLFVFVFVFVFVCVCVFACRCQCGCSLRRRSSRPCAGAECRRCPACAARPGGWPVRADTSTRDWRAAAASGRRTTARRPWSGTRWPYPFCRRGPCGRCGACSPRSSSPCLAMSNRRKEQHSFVTFHFPAMSKNDLARFISINVFRLGNLGFLIQQHVSNAD